VGAVAENKRENVNHGKMASMKKKLAKYSRLLWKRVYRPISPVTNPLLGKIKLIHVLGTLVLLVILSSLVTISPIFKAQERAAWWPWSAKRHAEMALIWLENGNEDQAVKELKKANKKTRALMKAEEKVRQPEKIRQEITSWEKVLEKKPYYRDVLLRLALLNYQLYEDEKAADYWEKANYLDPNNEEVRQVRKIIFSQP
jgi:tetratricopeptide (TPR) repeat protein